LNDSEKWYTDSMIHAINTNAAKEKK
jgi:hypothetical protein